MDGLRASILIINYMGERFLPACLTALAEQTVPRHTFEVLLLDNASPPGAAQQLRQHYPWVRVVASPVNLGFAQGNNLLATFAHAPLLILLNNDTIPDPFWLEELFRVLDEQSVHRVVSKLVFLHDPRLIQSAGLLLLRDGRGVDLGFRQQDVGQFEETRQVFAGCGAALAVHAPVEGRVLFDPHYFVYYEDTEQGWAAQRRGESNVYAPRALVRHAHGATQAEASAFFHFHNERNRALTSLRHGDLLLASLSGPSLFLRTARAVIRSVRGQLPASVARAYLAASGSFCRHLPRILWQRLFG